MPTRTPDPESRTPNNLPPSTPRRILLLSASAGAGHIRAADALLKQFQLHPAVINGGHVEHWDILKYTNAVFRTIYSKLYLDLVNRAPTLLGMVYDSTDKPWKETMAQAFEKLNAAPFIKALRDYNPDLIVATHFTPPNIINWLNTKHRRGQNPNPKIPAPAIVITDLDVHAMWLTKSYSRYFVSLEESKIYLQQMGIPEDKITISGIPTDPVFNTPKDKAATRKQLNLDPSRFTILVSAGGFGVGPIADLIEQLQHMHSPVQIIAIAGKSEELKSKLDKLAAKLLKTQDSRLTPRLHPVGFTREMDAYMAAADILISKPGGLTTAEAMARTLPMCIVNPIPGQEERNSDHLLEAGVAIKCNNPPTLAWKLEQLINNPQRLAQMRQNITAFAKPNAAQTIVNTLMSP